ncbi:MAG: 3-hydroxyacyl-[acyl-carrier-protein] dehydratase FabZ [Nitrospirae bacterium]|nr:MAG: 3-hydroxyacyl-[acyl-carrier-protein] dehydratase FabZ [Nitrospirota bacterium]
MRLLPHRYPFLLLDRITAVGEEAKWAEGLKNVTMNEEFFQGHFPGHPVMPGVLIVEGMAQLSGALALTTVEDPASKVIYFMSIEQAKFRRPVVPGDTLRYRVELIRRRRNVWVMGAEAKVDGNLVTEARFTAMVVDR